MTAPVLAPLEPEAAAPDAPLDDPELDPDDDPLFDEPLFEPLFDDPLFDEPLFEPLFDDPLFEPLFDDPLFEPLFDDPLFDEPELPLDAVLPGVLEAQAPCRVTMPNAPKEPSTLQRYRRRAGPEPEGVDEDSKRFILTSVASEWAGA
jgi:hypothetical protein